MKRILASVMVSLLLFSLCACGGEKNEIAGTWTIQTDETGYQIMEFSNDGIYAAQVSTRSRYGDITTSMYNVSGTYEITEDKTLIINNSKESGTFLWTDSIDNEDNDYWSLSGNELNVGGTKYIKN